MNTSFTPKYQRVKRVLIREIESGRFSAGAAFPSEAQLLEQFDVSRPTLVRSLQELVTEGYLYRQQGKGTFVADRNMSTGCETEPSAHTLTVFMSRQVAQLTGASREVQLRILRGVQEALGPAYRATQVREADPVSVDADTRRFIETSARGVALIIEPSFNPTLRLLLEERGWHVWAVNEPVDNSNYVSIDQEHAGYLATRFMIDEGRQHIALINGPADDYWGFADRLRGYKHALAEAGLAINPALIFEGANPIDSEAGRSMMRSLLESGVQCDAVVGASDAKAIGAMTHAIESRVGVPQQIAFVSIDNTLADQISPSLPAVAMPFEEMGYQAATQAFSFAKRSKSPRPVYTKINLQPTLVER